MPCPLVAILQHFTTRQSRNSDIEHYSAGVGIRAFGVASNVQKATTVCSILGCGLHYQNIAPFSIVACTIPGIPETGGAVCVGIIIKSFSVPVKIRNHIFAGFFEAATGTLNKEVFVHVFRASRVLLRRKSGKDICIDPLAASRIGPVVCRVKIRTKIFRCILAAFRCIDSRIPVCLGNLVCVHPSLPLWIPGRAY